MKRSKYDHSKLEGSDADLETSLKEYGLAWIETDTEYLFYYGIGYDDNEQGYNKFDFCSFDKSMDMSAEFNWVNWKDIHSYIGADSMMQFNDMHFTQQISDLLSYYGYENIFGSSYWEGLNYTDIINTDVTNAINNYNDCESIKMSIVETSAEYYSLYIGKNRITEGDTDDILKRVKQINKENGYDY